MLFSMSSVKLDRWKEMTDALSRTLNPARTESQEVPMAQYNISSVFRRRAINIDYLNAVLQEKLDKDPMLGQSRLVLLDDRVIISLSGDLLFPAGGAQLSESAHKALFNLGGALRLVDNQVGVNSYVREGKGQGKGKPDGYVSNWEFSLARATVIANVLKRSGYDKDIIAFGYASSRSRNLEGMPPEARSRLAERVDIVVVSESGSI
jgi:chemotaxis protein MotB